MTTLSWCPSCGEAIQDRFCQNCREVQVAKTGNLRLALACPCLLNEHDEVVTPCWAHLTQGELRES